MQYGLHGMLTIYLPIGLIVSAKMGKHSSV